MNPFFDLITIIFSLFFIAVFAIVLLILFNSKKMQKLKTSDFIDPKPFKDLQESINATSNINIVDLCDYEELKEELEYHKTRVKEITDELKRRDSEIMKARKKSIFS